MTRLLSRVTAVATVACLPLVLASALAAAEPIVGSGSIRLNVTRDTWFSEVGKEADGNNGGADRLKVKSIQEMSLIDFDPTSLRGRTMRAAALHVRPRGPDVLHRMTVSTFSAEWVEGTATGYEPQTGSSCFNWRQYPDVPCQWYDPYRDLRGPRSR